MANSTQNRVTHATMKLAFLHPDLGLGGAERLVVDACVALVELGHEVHMYTSHYEAARSFDETRAGGFPVEVHGDFLPRHILEKGHILFAMLRSVWLALKVGARCRDRYDVIFCDQVSTYVPVLRMLCPRTRILFYCHHPDLLLSQPGGLAKRLYRLPFDAIEQVTTALADRVVVNSLYTKQVYEDTFSVVRKTARVLYPCVRLDELNAISPKVKAPSSSIVLLSINRFERKKNILLAVNALVALRALVPDEVYGRVKLVLAGGYDTRVLENVEYFEEVSAVVRAGGVDDKVEYRRSFSDAEKIDRLESCTAVVYTPENEHFGIVPIEAMASARPVLAAMSGGPMESVVDGETGYLRKSGDAYAFAEAMAKLVSDLPRSQRMGVAGRERATKMFSREGFGQQLEKHCKEIVDEGFPVAAMLMSYVLTLPFLWIVLKLYMYAVLLCA
jgi:alpha-1,3/alpha-1,6-mannosyltransferase